MLKKKVKEMKEDQVWKSLDKKNAEAQKSQAEKDAEAMLKMGQEQGTRTQSILDAIGAIFDALFNWIYEILTDIYSALKFGGDLQKKIYKSQNKDLVKAWKESGGDEAKFMGALANSATGKKMGEVLASEKPEDAKKKDSLEKLVSSKFDPESVLATDRLFIAMDEQKLTDKQQNAVTEGMHKGGGLRQGVKEAGLTAQQEAAIFAKVALWGTQASTRADIIQDASKILGTGGEPSVAAPTQVPAQQQATAAAANPGSGGGAVVAAAAPPPAPPPPTSPGAGPAGTPGGVGSGPNKIPTVPDEQKMNDAVLDQVDFTGGTVVSSLQDLWNALRMKGIKFDRTQLEGLYKDVIHKGTYLGGSGRLGRVRLVYQPLIQVGFSKG